MRLTRLDLTNFRGLRRATVRFDKSFSLLIGENGVGKSTVLDATVALIAKLWSELGIARAYRRDISESDVTVEEETLIADLAFNLAGHTCMYRAVEQVIDHVDNPLFKGGLQTETTIQIPDERGLLADPEDLSEGLSCRGRDLRAALMQSNDTGLAVYYSTRRSLFRKGSSERVASSRDEPAFFEAINEQRELQIVELAEWWNSRDYLSVLGASSGKISENETAALRKTAYTLLDTVSELRSGVGLDKSATLFVNKGGLRIDIRWLSDGERSLLALALDLTRRLAQAYPKLEDPARDGEAVVLIDELDLHLHPKWQRRLPSLLVGTFKQCQFICTTHSPLMIGEVPPHQVFDLGSSSYGVGMETSEVPHPKQSYGLDATQVMTWLMGAEEARPDEVADLIRQASDALEEGDLGQAQKIANKLRALLNGPTPDVLEIETEISNLEYLADHEEDQED